MRKEVDAIAFGRRVRERRKDLGLSQAKVGKASGYSQTNIGWLELGNVKDPRVQAQDLAAPLHTSAEWLLWATGPKEVGPPIMSNEEIVDGYNLLPPEDRVEFSELMAKRLAALKKAKKRA